MTKKIELPQQSKAARKAASMTGSPFAVLLTLIPDKNSFEVRCYGKTDSYRYFAESVAGKAFDELARKDPPKNWETALETIQMPDNSPYQ